MTAQRGKRSFWMWVLSPPPSESHGWSWEKHVFFPLLSGICCTLREFLIHFSSEQLLFLLILTFFLGCTHGGSFYSPSHQEVKLRIFISVLTGGAGLLLLFLIMFLLGFSKRVRLTPWNSRGSGHSASAFLFYC